MVDPKYVALAIVVVLAVGYFAFYQKGGGIGRPGANASAVLLGALDRAANVSAYSLLFNTSVDGKSVAAAGIVVSGERGRVDVVDGFGIETRAYFGREGAFACVKGRDGKWMCAKHGENESFLITSIVNRGEGVLAQQRLGNITKVRGWVSSGVLLLRGSVLRKSVAGRQCDEIEFRTDYSAMSDADLAGIGLGRNAAAYRYQLTRQCLDVATGFALRSIVNLTEYGVNRVQESIASSFRPGPVADAEFALPGAVLAGDDFASLLAGVRERQRCRLMLPNETAAFNCFEQAAYAGKDVSYCVEIGSLQRRDVCVLTLVAIRPNAALCDEVSGSKDDCFFNIALKTNSSAACGRVREVPLSKVCLAEIGLDVNGCANAASAQDADACRFVVATRGGGSGACTQITNATLRAQCNGWFVVGNGSAGS